SAAQTLPAEVRVPLANAGHENLAERLEDRLAPRATPDDGDIRDVLARGERATGGPPGPWDGLAGARLWLRAGDAARAEEALARVGDPVPPGVIELERARIGFLADAPEAADAYWRACDPGDEHSTLEAW